MTRSPDAARRLLAAYDACMAAEGAARAERVAAFEREDPDIAGRLRAMLAFDADVDDAGPLDVESLVGALIDAPAADGAPAPATVGPFALLRLLGRGGMGEVWLAERDSGGFRQQVALKRLRSGRDSEELRRRFVQERRILADLSHAGIARFIDGGVDEAGAPWYAMELVEGVPITDFARARGLDLRARVALVAEVAEAVAYAQNRLVVHRDLKPSNILIDADGRPRLLDFGIAKILDDGAGGAGETAAGMRAMTPDYAAPEQILGEPISTATDVYALGVVLYQLLTGDLPHARGGASLESLVDSVRSESTERPSARLRRVSADRTLSSVDTTRTRAARALKGDLDTIAMTALRREPELRYPAAAALAADLRRWLDGRPIAAQADTAAYRLRKFVARNRLAVGSTSVVLLALIAGFGTALWQASVAREQAVRAQAEAAKATAIKDFLLASFNTAQIGEKTAAAGSPVTVLQLIKRGGEALLQDDKLDPEARLELLTALGELQRINGLNAQAEPLQLKALEIAREHYGATSEKYVYALVERATNLPILGRVEESNTILDEALAIMEKAQQQKTQSYPFALWRRGVNAYGMDRHDEALRLFERAEAACREHRPTDPIHGLALQWQANVHQLRDRFDAAEVALNNAIVLASASARPEQAEGLARLYLGDLFARKGDFDAALAEYERSLQFMRQTEAGDRNPDRAVLLANTARARHEAGQHAAALAEVRAALDIARHHPSGEPGRSLDSRARSAQLIIHLGEGDAAAALPLARELAARWPPGSTGAFYANNQMLLAEAELLGDQPGAARAAAERAVAIHEATDADALLARQARLLLAEALERQGDAAARASYERVLRPARADTAEPPTRARRLQRARALAGLARLARPADQQAALLRAREGLALLAEPRYLRERWVRDQLQAIEADAR